MSEEAGQKSGHEWLMRELSSDYCGIDYAPAALAVARKRHPTFDFREMDARCLDFDTDAFGLVTFSYNGIDAVGLEGRLAIIREVHRVLRPGGYFVFSSLNRNGCEWQPRWPNWEVFQGAGQSPYRPLRATAKLLRSGTYHLRYLGWQRDDGEVGVGNLAAHDFSLVAMFTSPLVTQSQLEEAGFTVIVTYDPEGNPILRDARRQSRAPWSCRRAQGL
jgi:SAM-dependent methyltransferase